MRPSRSLRRSKGASAIEFAIVLPVLIMLIFGGIEFSLLLYNYQVLTNASREGARKGIVLLENGARNPDSEIRKVVTDYTKDRMITFGAANDPVTTVTPDPNDPNPTDFGSNLRVTVSYDYTFLVLDAFGFGPKKLSSSTVMKNE